jgi:hypothetical protein
MPAQAASLTGEHPMWHDRAKSPIHYLLDHLPSRMMTTEREKETHGF